MKKCASCSKDLPDAALHCVFCGAKQATAPAAPAGLAKTVMGNFSAQEMLAHMRQQGVSAPGQPPPAAAPPPAAPAPALFPAMPPAAPNAPTLFDANAAARPPAGAPGPGPSMGGPMMGGPRGNLDSTMAPAGMAQGFNANAGAFNAAGGGPRGSVDATLPPPGHAQPAPPPATPLGAPVFSASPAVAPAPPPRAATPTAVATDPGADPLRSVGKMMLIFGLLRLVAFAAPTSLDPLTFQFEKFGDIFSAETGVMLSFLMAPAIGVLAILFGLLPLGTAVKGVIAATLGVAAFAVRYAFSDSLTWQQLVGELGLLVLLVGLVIRGGYRGSLVARVLVTLGVLATLAPELIPAGAGIPLVGEIQGLGDAATAAMIVGILKIVGLVLVIASLLAWLPAPASGASKLLFWLLLALMVAEPLVPLLVNGGGDAFQKPDALLAWAFVVSRYGLASWGLGALLGKSTE